MNQKELTSGASPGFLRRNPQLVKTGNKRGSSNRSDRNKPRDVAAPQPKLAKWKNQPTEYNGRRYDSKAEARRAQELDLMVRSGDILNWEPQPRFELGPRQERVRFVLRRTKRLDYRPDFLVVYMDGTIVVEDVKGAEKQRDRDIAKLWKQFGPCPLHIRRNDRVAEVVDPDNPAPVLPG